MMELLLRILLMMMWWFCSLLIVMVLHLFWSIWCSCCHCCYFYCCSPSSTVIISWQGNPLAKTFHNLQLRCMILVLRERQTDRQTDGWKGGQKDRETLRETERITVCVLASVSVCSRFMHPCLMLNLFCRPDGMSIIQNTSKILFIWNAMRLNFFFFFVHVCWEVFK